MKIAIPIESDKPDALISTVFARSKWFAIWDSDLKTYEILDNPYHDDKLQVGENVVWLLTKKNVGQFAAFEIGLKLQNESSIRHIQLILLPQKIKKLKDILYLMDNN